MTNIYNNGLLETPINDIFIQGTPIPLFDNKQLYRIIPSILSGNKPTNHITHLFEKLKPEIQGFIFDVTVYSLFSHYTNLSEYYNNVFINNDTSVHSIREASSQLIKKHTIDFFNFLNDTTNIDENNINYQIKKNIVKSCSIDNPGNVQNLSSLLRLLSCLSDSKNQTIQNKVKNLFKDINQPLISGMLIINKIGSMDNLRYFSQNKYDGNIFHHQILNSSCELLNDSKKSMLQFISTCNKYSNIGGKHFADYLSSLAESILFKESFFEQTINILTPNNKKLFWNNDLFKEKINLQLKDQNFSIIKSLEKSFHNDDTIMSEPIFKVLHSKKDLSPTLFQHENMVSVKFLYSDIFSVILNNQDQSYMYKLDNVNIEINEIFHLLSSCLSKHMLKNHYIEEYTISDSRNIDLSKNGVTLSFTNSSINPAQFFDFIHQVSELFNRVCKNKLSEISINNTQPVSKYNNLFPMIDIYYEEAFMLSQSSNNFLKAMKPKKF